MCKFILEKEQIKKLIEPMGNCFATHMITVEGKGVNFFYREFPNDESDSGWRFFSGEEEDKYVKVLKKVKSYDVNVIANYSPDIIPLLCSSYNTAYIRNFDTGEFEIIHNFDFKDELIK